MTPDTHEATMCLKSAIWSLWVHLGPHFDDCFRAASSAGEESRVPRSQPSASNIMPLSWPRLVTDVELFDISSLRTAEGNGKKAVCNLTSLMIGDEIAKQSESYQKKQ